jgi:hypothetical protein
VTVDYASYKKSTEVLIFEVSISILSVLQILKKNEFSSKKPTIKLGLTNTTR